MKNKNLLLIISLLLLFTFFVLIPKIKAVSQKSKQVSDTAKSIGLLTQKIHQTLNRPIRITKIRKKLSKKLNKQKIKHEITKDKHHITLTLQTPDVIHIIDLLNTFLEKSPAYIKEVIIMPVAGQYQVTITLWEGEKP